MEYNCHTVTVEDVIGISNSWKSIISFICKGQYSSIYIPSTLEKRQSFNL